MFQLVKKLKEANSILGTIWKPRSVYGEIVDVTNYTYKVNKTSTIKRVVVHSEIKIYSYNEIRTHAGIHPLDNFL